MTTLRRVYTDDTGDVQKLRFFCHGEPYRFWGLVEADLHLVCPAENGQFFLLGTDRLGRDIFSRILYGARISMTIGLLGVATSFVLGIVIGGLAGYWGGWFDLVVQRIIEMLQSIPTIPLCWRWRPSCPSMEPALRLSRNNLYSRAVRLDGACARCSFQTACLARRRLCSRGAIDGRKKPAHHRASSCARFMSHLIASATLTIPSMILGETTLSFLGLGLRPPITSWGVLLTEARSVSVLALYPWLLLPVRSGNICHPRLQFSGDGLRDAADPYK